MILKIDGVDITPYIVQKGIKWTRSDLDGDEAGRTMDGEMHRDRIGTVTRMDITCLPLSSEDAAVVLNAIYPEFFEVEYIDPMEGHVTKTMYSNNVPAIYIDVDTDMWEGIAFPLIAKKPR